MGWLESRYRAPSSCRVNTYHCALLCIIINLRVQRYQVCNIFFFFEAIDTNWKMTSSSECLKTMNNCRLCLQNFFLPFEPLKNDCFHRIKFELLKSFFIRNKKEREKMKASFDTHEKCSLDTTSVFFSTLDSVDCVINNNDDAFFMI